MVYFVINYIHKLESTMEYIHFPPIKMLEIDEKMLFDVQVQIKFGNPSTIL